MCFQERMKYSFTNFQVLVSPSLFAGELTFCCNLFIRRSVGYQSVCLHFFLFLLSLSLSAPSLSSSLFLFLSIYLSFSRPSSVCLHPPPSFLSSLPTTFYLSLPLSPSESVYAFVCLSVFISFCPILL